MTARFTRRGMIGITAGAVPVIALGGTLAGGTAQASVLIVHDDGLPAAQRFAAQVKTLGGSSWALQGDRVRLVRDLLDSRPAQIFGMTRHADQLLIAEIAREIGYREVALVRHRTNRQTITRCEQSLTSLVHASAYCWPEAFADLALASLRAQPPAPARRTMDPAFSWILRRRS